MKKYIQCVVCGNKFSSYNKNPKFCSIECKAKHQSYDIDFSKAADMYNRGMTQEEIAYSLNVSQKSIYSIFKRNNFKCRVAKKRNQNGNNNSNWVGNSATYATLHKRVEAKHGKPKLCSICGCVDEKVRYEWANITGDYFDIENGYKRMCVSCHRSFDKSIIGVKNNVKRTKK